MERQKELAFKYFLMKMFEWYKQKGGKPEENDFSALKVLKLLFFVCATETQFPHSDEKDLLDLFNDYYAMPYGPVEDEVYREFKTSEAPFNGLFKKKDGQPVFEYAILENETNEGLESEWKKYIDTSVKTLISKNSELVMQGAFDLVTITHYWSCWKTNYKIALQQKRRKIKISSNQIRGDKKYFSFEDYVEHNGFEPIFG